MSRGDAPTIGVGVFDGFPLTLERSILLAGIGTWRVPKHHVHIEAIACTISRIAKPRLSSLLFSKFNALFVTTLHARSATLTIAIDMMAPTARALSFLVFVRGNDVVKVLQG